VTEPITVASEMARFGYKLGECPLHEDHFESPAILNYIEQAIPEDKIKRTNLNPKLPDYWWVDVTGKTRGTERQQIGEALGDLDEVERLLNSYLGMVDEVTWLIEGVARSTGQGVAIYRYSFGPGKDQWVRQTYGAQKDPFESRPDLWPRFEALKSGLRMAGINIIETHDMAGSASAIVSMYNYSMRPEHTTLRRYLAYHVAPFSPDVDVENLARLKNCGIGPVKAKKLVDELGTFYHAITAEREELVPILGEAGVDRLWGTIGRVV